MEDSLQRQVKGRIEGMLKRIENQKNLIADLRQTIATMEAEQARGSGLVTSNIDGGSHVLPRYGKGTAKE